jgi:lipoyl(octanoyl) transferase
MQKVKLTDLGLHPYGETLSIQRNYFEAIKKIKVNNRTVEIPDPTPNYMFLVSHPHTYTMGKNGNMKNVLLPQEQLQKAGIDFFQTNRGGDITYHGPGQVVGYPILDLDNFNADIHAYMRDLEEVIIKVLQEYNLSGQRSEGETGVWLDVGEPTARKICAMGVHTSRWVTMHGFALNVNTDLTYFNHIIPCGIQNKGITSLQKELGNKINETEVKEKILKHFAQIFKCEFARF